MRILLEQIRVYINKAYVLLQDKNINEAYDSFKKALELSCSNDLDKSLLGKFFKKQEDEVLLNYVNHFKNSIINQTVSDFIKIIAYNYLAIILEVQGNTSEAIQYLDDALKFDPLNDIHFLTLSNNAGILFRNDKKKCEDFFSSNADVTFKDKIFYLNWGHFLYQTRRFPEAIAIYKSINEEDSSFTLLTAWVNRGLAHMKLKYFEGAIQIFSKLVENYPCHSFGFTYIADVFFEKGEYQKAILYYTHAINQEKYPQNRMIYLKRGLAYQKSDEPEKDFLARQDFNYAYGPPVLSDKKFKKFHLLQYRKDEKPEDVLKDVKKRKLGC